MTTRGNEKALRDAAGWVDNTAGLLYCSTLDVLFCVN